RVMRAIANEVCNERIEAAPSLSASAEKLSLEIDKWFSERGLPLSTEANDILHLTGTIASILEPLHEDVHATFLAGQEDSPISQQPAMGEAQS
ncbi:MAG: hypothetical protein JOZ33_02640, partial [Acidobacteriaceae bacterium]|nr:hypothetical protein [Acidobacteriaceae bacterium]